MASVEIEDSWTSIDALDLTIENTCVSDSMYLVMNDPTSFLLNGEIIACKAHAVGFTDSLTTPTYGTLFLTNYRLFFASFKSEKNQDKEVNQIEIPLCSIAQLKVLSRNKQGDFGILSFLEISCKNFKVLKFGFPYDCLSSDLYLQMISIRQAECVNFAFLYPCSNLLPDTRGWSVYSPKAEYNRILTNCEDSVNEVRSRYRITSVNKHYNFCPTYPNYFLVPNDMSDHELKRISKFRARGRIPAVSYVHVNGAGILRCAQPLVGIRRKRCAADENYISAFRKCNPHNTKLHFIDCRNQTSAYANIALGGGFENTAYYRNSEMHFMGIENIHSMRDSIKRLFELVKADTSVNEKKNWLSYLESTRWLEHVGSLLTSTSMCVDFIQNKNSSVVVHCSDGWDRTSQIVSLTKLCLDPFFRTMEGFQCLIEQEWCSFGYQFATRSGYANYNLNYWDDANCSPVFTQFLDAVWQLTKQFPCAFQFNSKYLIALIDELYSSSSGTFIFDCEADRLNSNASTRSISTWTKLANLESSTTFANPFYVCADSGNNLSPMVIQYTWHTSSLSLWLPYYLRSRNNSDEILAEQSWAMEQKLRQKELEGNFLDVSQQLAEQNKENLKLQAEIKKLKIDHKKMHRQLVGQVYCDSSKGIIVHEEDSDDEEDGVLLSMSRADKAKLDSRNSSFLGGEISRTFNLVESYFKEM